MFCKQRRGVGNLISNSLPRLKTWVELLLSCFNGQLSSETNYVEPFKGKCKKIPLNPRKSDIFKVEIPLLKTTWCCLGRFNMKVFLDSFSKCEALARATRSFQFYIFSPSESRGSWALCMLARSLRPLCLRRGVILFISKISYAMMLLLLVRTTS